MDEPYEYQNGGQWDWFGGRLILAMFENGFSREARDKLLEIVRKNLRNDGLFEWDTREGPGRGSDYYAGSAGSLARALFEGYFGVQAVGENGLCLEPRLGADTAPVRSDLPAAGLFAAMIISLCADRKKIALPSIAIFGRRGPGDNSSSPGSYSGCMAASRIRPNDQGPATTARQSLIRTSSGDRRRGRFHQASRDRISRTHVWRSGWKRTGGALRYFRPME